MDSQIKDVSDTAFWIASLRAQESERPDALFKDPFAGRLAAERGKRIADAMPTSRMVGWTVALRTRIIDEFILESIRGGVDAVLNLGAGLDARPYRMSLPDSLLWIEADYPHMIDYKESRLERETLRCRLERVRIDLADRTERRQLLERVDGQANEILVLTEGVIPYLRNEDVAALADDLLATSHARLWIVDYFSELALAYRRRQTGRTMENAPFRFAPGDWFAFFERAGWRPRETRYFVEETRRLGREMPVPLRLKLLAILSQLFMSRARRTERARFAGYSLLERVDARP